MIKFVLHYNVAPELSKSIHPRKFGNHLTVHQLPDQPTDQPTDCPIDRPSAPQGSQCLISHFLASLGAQVQPDIVHPYCDQLAAVKTGYMLNSIT